jgi:hypothetical protein
VVLTSVRRSLRLARTESQVDLQRALLGRSVNRKTTLPEPASLKARSPTKIINTRLLASASDVPALWLRRLVVTSVAATS